MAYPLRGANTTQYTAADLLSQAAADVISSDEVISGYPYFNWNTNTWENFLVAYAGLKNLSDPTVSATYKIFMQLLTILQFMDPNLAADTDLGTAHTTDIFPGDNFSDDGEDLAITAVKIQLSTIGPLIDYWYEGGTFAKMGVFMFGKDLQINKPNWINTANVLISLPLFQYANGWFCNLLPGCYGTITTYKRTVPQPVNFSVNGGAIQSMPVLPV
jgi:hypothetical protein